MKLPTTRILVTMPIPIHGGAPTLILRRSAYEKSGLARAAIDEKLGLTDQEFRVDANLVCIGPIYDGEGFGEFVEELERLGLAYYEDFFELSGNWPEWLALLAGGAGGAGRSSPSQPHE